MDSEDPPDDNCTLKPNFKLDLDLQSSSLPRISHIN